MMFYPPFRLRYHFLLQTPLFLLRHSVENKCDRILCLLNVSSSLQWMAY